MNKSIGHHAQYLGIYRSSSQGIIVIFAETPAKHYWNTSHDLFDLITSKRGNQFADSGTVSIFHHYIKDHINNL